MALYVSRLFFVYFAHHGFVLAVYILKSVAKNNDLFFVKLIPIIFNGMKDFPTGLRYFFCKIIHYCAIILQRFRS